MDTKKVLSSKMSNVSAKTWMVGCLVIETAMTMVTWAAIPLFFKIWSVACLIVETFLIAREFVVNPLKQRVAPGVYA